MSTISNAQGVTILEGIHPVLCYQRAVTSQRGQWPRANYVHPLYDLDGECLTEDFPTDHGHQRGVYWAWHQVLVDDQPMGDAWTCTDFQWDVREVKTETTSDRATIQASVFWKSPALQDQAGQLRRLVQEQTTIVVHQQHQDVRWIDFTIELSALVEGVKIGGSEDDKGYGGFSARLKLSDQTVFTGTEGPIEPTMNAIEAGAAIDTSNATGGVSIFPHPENPGFPTPWILRQSRSMQNAVYPGRSPVQLSQTEPLVLRYRLGIHRGTWDAAKISDYQQAYQAQCESPN
ncbi:DUF6807 family protein [Aureliella helgolandensis]|nr:DUF6807 family protein [Aureliella helgolandensis]